MGARRRKEVGFRRLLFAIRFAFGYWVPIAGISHAPQTSLYADRSHIATGLFSLNLPHRFALAKDSKVLPKLTAGGSFFISSGSNPSSYYQPIAKLLLPLAKNLNWFTEWRYYGYGEAFYLYEGFHAHLVTTGLRFTR